MMNTTLHLRNELRRLENGLAPAEKPVEKSKKERKHNCGNNFSYMKFLMKLALCIVVLFGITVTSLFLSNYSREVRLKKEGNLIVEKIEEFRKIHNRLPSSLSEIGVSENELYYNKLDEKDYTVWYGKQLGESGYYDSRKKRWDVGG